MAKTKSLEELKKEQKTLADLIRKKEREREDNALKKAGNTFMESLSKMKPDKAQVHIDNMKLNEDELVFIESSIQKIKKKRAKEAESSPTAPPDTFGHPVNSGSNT